MMSLGTWRLSGGRQAGVATEVSVPCREEISQPLQDVCVLDSQLAEVRCSLLGNTVEGRRKEFGLGAEVLKDDWLRHADVRRDVRHARLLVAVGGEVGHRRVEDAGAARRSVQATARRPISDGRTLLLLRAHARQLELAEPNVMVDNHLSKD